MDPNAASSAAEHITAVVATLDGVTTVLVGFLFVCLIFPRMVKNRPQYYAAMAAIIGIILLHTLTLMFSQSSGLLTFGGVFTGLLQIATLILLVLSVGGLSMRELAGEMADAYEVIRRGETQKEVVIPISGQMKRRPTAAPPAGTPIADDDDDDSEHKVFHIDSGPTAAEPHASTDDDPHGTTIPLQ
jgi:hypothetical protein